MATDTKGIQLGAIYRDRITKFEGVCTARYDFLTSSQRVRLEGRERAADGKVVDVTVDSEQVEFLEFPDDMRQLWEDSERR